MPPAPSGLIVFSILNPHPPATPSLEKETEKAPPFCPDCISYTPSTKSPDSLCEHRASSCTVVPTGKKRSMSDVLLYESYTMCSDKPSSFTVNTSWIVLVSPRPEYTAQASLA